MRSPLPNKCQRSGLKSRSGRLPHRESPTSRRRLKPVIFLDRDGVVNVDSPEYIKNWSEFEFIPGSIEAIKRLTVKGFGIIIITNQSAVNRRLISDQGLARLHARMTRTLRCAGGAIQDIFYCPHTPQQRCACRKPKPGLLRQAQARYAIDLSAACVVGDSVKDIESARNAGCRLSILVRTGHGMQAEKTLTERHLYPDHVAPDLLAAANWIISLQPQATTPCRIGKRC